MVTSEHMAKLLQDMPELLSEKKQRFMKQYAINEEMAHALAYSPENETFEELAKASGNPTLVARTMLGTLTELRRDGVQTENITEHELNDVFRLVNEGKIAKEAIPSVLKETALQPEKGVQDAIRRLGLGGVGEEEARKIIGDIVHEKHDYVKENFNYTMTLFRPPMGEFSERTLALTQSLGYKSVFWSFAYVDWDTSKQLGYDAAYSKVSGALHNGAVYLLHAVSKDNAQILGPFIEEAKKEGFEFARLS
jgi:hypothetical protein